MAIEIRIESSWQTDDGEGHSIEVSTSERSHPGEDPSEDSRWFAGGDVGELKRHLNEWAEDRGLAYEDIAAVSSGTLTKLLLGIST